VKVVFTVLDALPARHVGVEHTPVLSELARAGGGVPSTALSVMTSATYPNHATFITGVAPRAHGIVTNWVPQTGRVVPAWEIGPAVPTLFDAARSAGRTTAAVFGDQCLVGVMGARVADTHWPVDGVPPPEVRRDAHDYIDDRDTIVELVAALDARPDLVVSQLNAPDTAAHVHGPDSEAALECYRGTDALLALAREHIDWDDTVWIIVSDHDQEPLDDVPPIDLRREFARRGVDLFALPEGSATVICGAGAHDARRWLTEIDGIEGTAPFHVPDPELECVLAWSTPRRAFGFEEMGTELGTHGGPRTRTQVAVVTGGHPLVAPLAHGVASRRVTARDWAPTIAALLGFDLTGASGRSML
jgi:arylsulfatase A-like enzyme